MAGYLNRFENAMNNGYNNAAFFYDRLARLVFGNKLQQAQATFLHLIPQDARVLIVGGGSGWKLEELARIYHNSKLSITYVEAAPKMVELAQKRITSDPALSEAPFLTNFITAPIQDAQLGGHYDVIITAFFFDNFNDHEAGDIVSKLLPHFATGGQWFYTDFRNSGATNHKLLLKSMYLFFGLICGLSNRQLPDMYRIFDKRGLMPVHVKQLMNGLIESAVYIKSMT